MNTGHLVRLGYGSEDSVASSARAGELRSARGIARSRRTEDDGNREGRSRRNTGKGLLFNAVETLAIGTVQINN